MKSVEQVLNDARELIANPVHRTVFTNARNQSGEPVSAWDDRAVCRCSYGAVMHAAGMREIIGDPATGLVLDAMMVLDRSSNQLFGQSTIEANDTRSHAEVMLLFNHAIVHAESLA